MTTVDQLLLKIVNHTSPTIEETISKRDSKILRSLATSISSNFFITENQSTLLLKILRENSQHFDNFKTEILETISLPRWSRSFRQIEQVKKMYVGADKEGEPCLFVEFTFNQQIRTILLGLAKGLDNFSQSSNAKVYQADLTEHNIVVLVELLSNYNFEIDENIKNHYDTIKSWSEEVVRNQFLITNIIHPNFQKAIAADLGMETAIDNNILKDRSMRYQYFIEKTEKNGENLTSYIAYRENTKIHVNKNNHSLADVVKSLVELKRLPCMIIFDARDDEKNHKNLENLDEILHQLNLTDEVGIYFRMANTEIGKNFNTLIGNRQYNKKLTDVTQIVGIQSGKIPKFMLSNAWKPMSVISLDNTMGARHGKTAVYSNCCDLIVEYTDAPALTEKVKWR